MASLSIEPPGGGAAAKPVAKTVEEFQREMEELLKQNPFTGVNSPTGYGKSKAMEAYEKTFMARRPQKPDLGIFKGNDPKWQIWAIQE